MLYKKRQSYGADLASLTNANIETYVSDQNKKWQLMDHFKNDPWITFFEAQHINKSKFYFLFFLRIGPHYASRYDGEGDHYARHRECIESIKKNLPLVSYVVYGVNAPAKSGAGIGVLIMYKATYDAPSVFFYVLASAHDFFSTAVIIRGAHITMVGWMGAEQSAPVTLYAGYANPVQSTTSEIGVSGGGILSQYKEAAIMATTPTQKPQVIWIIAVVRRDNPTIKPVLHHIPALSEREARLLLVREHVCFFAGRIPVQEVAA